MTTEPRAWAIPPEPENGTRIRDREGREWSRRPIDSDTYWVSDFGGVTDWIGVLRRAPLTEVVETEVEAAARRLREAGFATRHTAGYAGAYNDLLSLARHVLNGGTL